MRRIDLESAQLQPHFIGSWALETQALCAALIDFFEHNRALHTQGKMAGGLNLEAKNSTDLSIRPAELEQSSHQPVREYIEQLFLCYRDYCEQWPFLKSILPRLDIGAFNIQRYRPGGHFLKLHSERTTVGTAHRVFAWMTYLNDVEQGGATYFPHFDLEIRPTAGKTLIWPAEWTHAHQARVLDAGVKYIITGWMHFPVQD